MAITVYDDPCTETKPPTKLITIDDFALQSTSSSSSSSSLVNLTSTKTFRDSVRSFLRDYGEIEDYTVDGNAVYRVCLVSKSTGVAFPLFVVEELISVDSSPNPLCDFCRCVGWGHHYVSKRKYHLIIPESDKWKKPLINDSLMVTSHMMHGVIHCNGYGHLLCINAHDDDDKYLCGNRIMDFWNRLCLTLHTRKISLEDISKKGSMDLRLLHGVAYGRPWFGKWGYMFSHGSFGIREEQYSRAINILNSIDIDKIIEDFSATSKERIVKMIIGFYRESSETTLVTLSDLFQSMLAFSSKAPVERKTAMALVAMSLDDDEDIVDSPFSSSSPEQLESDDISNDSRGILVDNDDDYDGDTSILGIKLPMYDSFDAMAKGLYSRYPGRRLNDAAHAVLSVFEQRKSVVITRQELRDAVRNSIGDTGLIDFLLKHIDKVLIKDHIVVQRFSSPETRKLQFSLSRISSRALVQEPKKIKKPKPPQESNQWTSTAPGLDPYADIFYMYQSLLLAYPDSDIYCDASDIILNCKSFVKEWSLPSYQEQNSLTVSCNVLPNHQELLRDFTRKLPSGELVTVPRNATIRELKSAVEKALRDTYCVMDTFEVTEIKNKDLVKIDETSGLLSEESSNVKTEFVVIGFGLDTVTELRYEGGYDDWTVECKCGARDDDGERMVACDDCKVWHHTMCNSIEDDEDVPLVFLCNKCLSDRFRSKKRSFATR
ncbi:unnamed protein product [Cochlearia groenlandica]